MLIPFSWLKEFIELKASAEEVGEKLSLATIGVEEVKREEKESILNLEVTYNRGDLLSILGVARELAALYNRNLLQEEEEFKPSDGIDELSVKSVEYLSPLYTLALIQNLSYQKTPEKMERRLELAGMRPINLFADITNYVMLEYGQPLHAFDAEKVRKRDKSLSIRVRNAKQGETIKTLDDAAHKLKISDIVIADKKGPIAVAGVMGGKDTEVDLNTKEILLEAAIFDPIAIRRTARRLGLRSEASTRFEHYLSSKNLFKALNKATKLYQRHGKGKIVGFGQVGEMKEKKEAVTLTQAKMSNLLGTEIDISEAHNCLKRLGFKVMSAERGLIAWPPHFRGDINFEEDLIEEVARLHGYENLPAVPPATGTIDICQSALEYPRDYLSNLLMGIGFSEIRSYPFLSRESLIHQNTKALRKLKNPISAEAEYLKDNGLLTLFEIAKKNAPRQKHGRIFELEKVYPKQGEFFALTAAIWGTPEPYRTLKGVLEVLLTKAHLDYEFTPTKHGFLHPNKAAQVLANGKVVGVIGEAHPHLAESYGLKNVALFELNLEEMAKYIQRWKILTPISKYPEVYEDFSFFLPYEKQFGPLIKRIKLLDEVIREVELADLFDRKGQRSITLRLTFQADTKELSSKDIKPVREKIAKLIKLSGGTLRT